MLTVRARTRSELAAALAKRLVPDDVADEVLARFVELGFIDDEAFATAWVTSRQGGRGLASGALLQELRTKGVDPDVAKAAVAAVDPADEIAKATELVRRRLAAMSGLPSQTQYRRLAGMLARKGYSGAVTAQVVRAALDAEEPDSIDE